MDNRGLELTPSLFANILIELFDGKIFKRQEAILKVKEYYVTTGGVLENDRDLIAVFKAATRLLKNKGLINQGYGAWKLNYKKDNVKIVKVKTESKKIKYNVDEEVGFGDCAVYVYFYDIYKRFAEINNSKFFECKIGRTDRDPIHRIFNQSGTCYPEKPHIALIIYCDNSKSLESAIHSALRYKGREVKGSLGKEWFMTSPEEIKEIYSYLQKILDINH